MEDQLGPQMLGRGWHGARASRPEPGRMGRRWAAPCMVALLVSVSFAEEGADGPAQPVAATLPAAVEVYHRMATGASRPLLGQNLGHARGGVRDGFARFVIGLGESSGRVPAMVGLDYGMDVMPTEDAMRHANRYLKAYARRGGFVTVSMHPPNPWHQSGVHDTRIGDWTDLLQGDQRVRRQWRASLDRAAWGLAELQDAGIPVLWRPLHEMNGDWFWWSPRRQGRPLPPAAFQQLWQDMFDYFTHDKGLRNLIWVYAAAMQTSSGQPGVDHYFPGADVVDIVAVDWYTDHPDRPDPFRNFKKLRQLQKPKAIAEFGPARQRAGKFALEKLDRVLHEQRLAYIHFWHSWPGARVAVADLEGGADWIRESHVGSLPFQ